MINPPKKLISSNEFTIVSDKLEFQPKSLLKNSDNKLIIPNSLKRTHTEEKNTIIEHITNKDFAPLCIDSTTVCEFAVMLMYLLFCDF